MITREPRRSKPVTAAIELNPHSLNVFGNQPLVSVLIDCGADTYILQLPTDLQVYLNRKLSQKLTTENTR
ncbi:hypothetical protein KQR54_15070 [Mycobacterium gordonae]|uniref:hypothetical protein n=1 Tax=Mycobacterium gordonae TaxID=1778 RepID=UPI00210BC61F|nr:hypothetical protein [Mycobacterium gordonae]MCQ4362435.1 hypothetical protein [Mycobacterium gordonae]